jgi:sulfatase modifying factor 1
MGKHTNRLVQSATPQATGTSRRFPIWLIVPVLLLAGLVAGVLAIGWTSEYDPRRDADSAPPEMVSIPDGTYWMGRDDGPPDESPRHEVTVSPFEMDATEVTVGQFAHFVKETGYVTVAERPFNPHKYPGTPPEFQKSGSAVFVPCDVPLYGPWETPTPPWWRYVPGACWRHPEGPESNLKGKKNYPAVQIAYEDAEAYAKWAGKRLPTEAEWEWAARGGLDGKPYCWGDAKQGDGGKWYANTYQGKFPAEDRGEDGFAGLAPVKSFPANGYGLYDMSGNAWEWCSDWYDPGYYKAAPKDNPKGPERGPLVEGEGQPQKVRRGGSFLCDDSYCRRYLPSARDKNPTDSSANHTGFRCVKDAK